MTISLPSREIYTVDIPEVRNFAAAFHYNFFVKDEGVNDSGELPNQALVRPAEERDAAFIQFATTRAPRFVEFKFTPPRLADLGRLVSDQDVRDNVFDAARPSISLNDNLDKVVSEEQFASFNFASVNFEDGEIEGKVYQLVSGTLTQFFVDEEHNNDVSAYRAASALNAATPKSIRPHFLARSLSSPEDSTGLSFFSEGNKRLDTKNKNVKNMISRTGRDARQVRDAWFERLKSVRVNVQINGKLFHDVIDRTLLDPSSPYGEDLHTLHSYSKVFQNKIKQNQSLHISEDDFKTKVPFVDLKVQRTAHVPQRRPVEIVGFIIDKTEVLENGDIINHDPVVVESRSAVTTADFKIKYGTCYRYAIRTVAKFTVPAIDEDTGSIATLGLLVSSKPSRAIYIRTRETVAPPPPADIDFTWDYERDKLLIHWSFPTNSQQDVKKFQVFRRQSIDAPFELLKVYDFDDSVIKYDDEETPDPRVVEHLTSPATFYIDDDFEKTSRFIYTVTCIDAHGYTSNYGAQFQIGFDRFKNKIVKTLVSHSGAPKAYPNLYLEADMFVDTIRVSGPHSKRLKLYFNPEYYYLTDDDDRLTKVIATRQQSGEYKLQLINLDNQKSQMLSIGIDDQLQSSAKNTVLPKFRFGRPKKTKRSR